jgi:transposase
MKLYAGIDLHSSNNYLGIIDAEGKPLFGKRLSNDLTQIRYALEPFRKKIAGIAVESTYNWYWLVDGLQSHGYKVHLANPSAMRQYEGLKHTDDKWDSYWLAHMLKLGILPTGYIYPKQRRPMRDLMRRRLKFVQQRTTHILSLQSMLNRHLAMQLDQKAQAQRRRQALRGPVCGPGGQKQYQHDRVFGQKSKAHGKGTSFGSKT